MKAAERHKMVKTSNIEQKALLYLLRRKNETKI
jgi:hypothetical protein